MILRIVDGGLKKWLARPCRIFPLCGPAEIGDVGVKGPQSVVTKSVPLMMIIGRLPRTGLPDRKWKDSFRYAVTQALTTCWSRMVDQSDRHPGCASGRT